MKTASLLTLTVCLLGLPLTAAADRPDVFDFEFTYVAQGGGDTLIPDYEVHWYLLTLTLAPANPAEPINYLELEIAGLSHANPGDLSILLLDPQGLGIDVMDDAGNGIDLVDVDLLFTDFKVGIPLPHDGSAIQPYPDTIYAPDGPRQFLDYAGTLVGTAPWVIVITDDATNDSGSFESVTLRGGVVPEPMTLALLGFGAFAALRRRR